VWSNWQVHEDERRSLVRRLEREAFGIRVTLAGSAVLLLLAARLLIAARAPWLMVAAAAGAAFFWVRLSRRLAAIQAALRRGGLPALPGEAAADAGLALTPARFAVMLLAVLVSVGICMATFVWLSGKLRSGAP
jgi:hypothetical protein